MHNKLCTEPFDFTLHHAKGKIFTSIMLKHDTWFNAIAVTDVPGLELVESHSDEFLQDCAVIK